MCMCVRAAPAALSPSPSPGGKAQPPQRMLSAARAAPSAPWGRRESTGAAVGSSGRALLPPGHRDCGAARVRRDQGDPLLCAGWGVTGRARKVPCALGQPAV